MNKKYRLKKEVLNYSSGDIIPSGEIFEQIGDTRRYESKNGWQMSSEAVRLTDWFELINERIEVGKIEYAVTFSGHAIEVYTDNPIPIKKFPLIRDAIEKVLNDEKEFEFRYEYRVYDKPMYTKEQLELAFWSGRQAAPVAGFATGFDSSAFKFKTFHEYLDWINLRQ